MPIANDSTTVLDGRLYGEVEQADSATLYRLDPVTGEPVAHAANVRLGLHPVFAADLVWIPSGDGDAVVGLDPVTLAVRATVRVPALIGISVAGPDTVIASGAHQVSVIRDGTVSHHFNITQDITSVAVSADGKRLYVATVAGGAPGPGQIETLDPQTGSAVAPPVQTVATAMGMQASGGGLWFTSTSGTQASIEFLPYGGHRPVAPTLDVGMSGGGTFPSISGGVAWLGSTNQLGCADPGTGVLRGHVPVSARDGIVLAAISGLSVLDGKVYATYRGINGGPDSALIVMTPPAACFGR